MYHKHLKETDSTQKQLLEIIASSKEQDILISTQKQNHGYGRNDNEWQHLSNALAFSCTVKPSNPPTLTPLEVGVHLCHYLKKKWDKDTLLKWPNDLLSTDGQKCGGILCNYIDNNNIAIGIGINWGECDSYSNLFQDKQLSSLEYRDIPSEIYSYFQQNRLDNRSIINEWNLLCAHLNTRVSIESYQGIFTGIGKNGEAILDNAKYFLSGSLFINPD